MPKHLLLCMASLLSLVACAPQQTVEISEPIPYSLDAGGVQLRGAPLRIDFGRTDHSTIPAMTKLVGSAPSDQASCGAEIMQVSWKDGTSLYFRAGDFRGWSNGDQRAGLTCG